MAAQHRGTRQVEKVICEEWGTGQGRQSSLTVCPFLLKGEGQAGIRIHSRPCRWQSSFHSHQCSSCSGCQGMTMSRLLSNCNNQMAKNLQDQEGEFSLGLASASASALALGTALAGSSARAAQDREKRQMLVRFSSVLSQSRFVATDQNGEGHRAKKGIGPHVSYLFAVHPQPHPPLQSSPHFPHPPWQLVEVCNQRE
jgi:hypothetical protein